MTYCTQALCQLESAGPGLVKGEVLVVHVSHGPDARVVAVERHHTASSRVRAPRH